MKSKYGFNSRSENEARAYQEIMKGYVDKTTELVAFIKCANQTIRDILNDFAKAHGMKEQEIIHKFSIRDTIFASWGYGKEAYTGQGNVPNYGQRLEVRMVWSSSEYWPKEYQRDRDWMLSHLVFHISTVEPWHPYYGAVEINQLKEVLRKSLGFDENFFISL